MKRWAILLFAAVAFSACGNDNNNGGSSETTKSNSTSATSDNGNPSYDPNRGEGKFKNVEIPATLDVAMAEKGQQIFGVKCGSCHKLTDEKLVGPGWQGVTSRHKPEWIMNFITNTDEMINKDPKAQAQLEICLVRMPNQNLKDDEARSLLEFMRRNDGVKP
ncbi:hypothetical protein BH09BAC2_BH09BAC2_04400 [soil metagenome]